MKKKEHKSIEFDRPVHLYLDDLLEIETILKEGLKIKELKISFDDYEATSFSEIPEETKKVTISLEIQSYEPYIYISFYKRSARIWISSSNLEIEGAVAKIKDLLKKRERALIFYSSKVLNWSSYLISISASTLFFWLEERMSKNIQITFLIIILLAFIFWTFTTLKPVNSIIEFQKKKNAPIFFQRNKDRILVGLIVGIPVAIFSFLLGFIFRK